MTRYSASRGIRYSAPPGPDGSRTDDDEAAQAQTDDRQDAASEVGIEAAVTGVEETPADD